VTRLRFSNLCSSRAYRDHASRVKPSALHSSLPTP
jgi:hypothetical protein